MTTKHTPGPWTSTLDGNSVKSYHDDGSVRGWIALIKEDGCASNDHKARIAEAMANARVIAAAPDLLAVARRAVGTCTCHATMRQDVPCLSCAARAAIAKAKGADHA